MRPSWSSNATGVTSGKPRPVHEPSRATSQTSSKKRDVEDVQSWEARLSSPSRLAQLWLLGCKTSNHACSTATAKARARLPAYRSAFALLLVAFALAGVAVVLLPKGGAIAAPTPYKIDIYAHDPISFMTVQVSSRPSAHQTTEHFVLQTGSLGDQVNILLFPPRTKGSHANQVSVGMEINDWAETIPSLI